jgi:hypothetical protein
MELVVRVPLRRSVARVERWNYERAGMSPAKQEEQRVESLVASLLPAEIEGAWKLLCTNVLMRAAHVVRGNSYTNKECLRQKLEAMRWIEGRRGIITFEDACCAVGMDPDRARGMIAADEDKPPIKVKKPPTLVFDKRTIHATALVGRAS